QPTPQPGAPGQGAGATGAAGAGAGGAGTGGGTGQSAAPGGGAAPGGESGGAAPGGESGGAAAPGTEQPAGTEQSSGPEQTSGTEQTTGTEQPPATGAAAGGGAASTAPSGGESGETGGAQPGSGTPGTPQEVSLRGLVTGPDPGGVTVILGPTSLTEAADQNAEPAPGTDEQTASGLRAARNVIGKVPSTALRVATAQDPPTVTTTTNDDGTWAIAGIRPQGFYLLTLARAGYQTQRFIVNGATLTGADPMRVALVAGDGAMSGTVTGPDGPVGAATVTITDGRVSVQTSTVSPGAEGTPGSWSVTGLSTPGTYLVSAAAQGFGTESALITLGA